MEDIVYEYFIKPIWEKSGYNPVNTIVYATIALISLYFLHKWLKKNYEINTNFVYNLIPFILLGSTVRVVTDSIDNGKFLPITPIHEWILNSGIYDYGYFTVTPGIYIVISAILITTLVILKKINRTEYLGKVGLALWVPHFLLLIPFFEYWVFAIPILILGVLPAYVGFKKFKDKVYALAIGGQAFDGAATFIAIDVFSNMTGIKYFEQHVLSSIIGTLGGYWSFYMIKVIIAWLVIKSVIDEKIDQEDKYFIALIVLIIGLAPGFRDVLRMIMGA